MLLIIVGGTMVAALGLQMAQALSLQVPASADPRAQYYEQQLAQLPYHGDGHGHTQRRI